MVKALCQEMVLRQQELEEDQIETLYLGGGTPSILSPEDLETLFETIHKIFPLSPSAEITLEANPEDLTKPNLSAYQDLRINRLSIGVQTLDNEKLKFLNRSHQATQAVEGIHLARTMGFNNLSLDLMYGLPDQSLEAWKKTLQQTLEFQPEHLSAYALTIEPPTVFGNWLKRGKMKSVNDDLAAQHLEWMMSFLEDRGYQHYEISNFCKPGYASIHNSNYWKAEKYIGIGPGAHSYHGQTRQFNIKNNPLYIKSIFQGTIPFEREVLSEKDKINEYLFTSLRTSWGCDLEKLLSQYHYDLRNRNKNYMDQLIQNGFAVLEGSHFILTQKGKLLADKITVELLVP